MNYQIERLHTEQMILSCFINQYRNDEFNQMEFKDYKLPFELFKANITNKLCAKAISNLQEENKPIDDFTILCYIEKHTKINQAEWLELVSNLWTSFDTMILHMNQLKDLDIEETRLNRLKAIK